MNAKDFFKSIGQYKYPIIVLVSGLLLITMPISSSSSEKKDTQLNDEERLEYILRQCNGVGDASVLISDNGAVIVCDGADDPGVLLAVTNAAKAFTGFSSDRIQVLKTTIDIGG